jgi:predicted heme/steroid binding protein
VERDEWIWNLEFTQQIEALWKDGSEEAMIEAGKLLTEELLRNTDDISGIIHKEDE